MKPVNDDFVEQMAWTVLALGAAAIAQFLLRGGIAEPMFMTAAGAMLGKVWGKRPGDVSMREAVRISNAITDERKDAP